MNVRTLLNKLRLKEHQNIRVLDKRADYFLESVNTKEIVEQCGKSRVSDFEYSTFGDCFLVYINKKKQ